MATTIRINEDVKQRLKLQSIETGISQLDLANRYIIEGIKYDNTPKKIEGIKYDNTPKKPIKTIEELEKILKHDKNEYESPKKIDWEEYKIPEKIKNGKINKPIKTIEELEKVLKHDGKGEKDPLEDIVGIIKTDEMVDSVKLKKDSYKR